MLAISVFHIYKLLLLIQLNPSNVLQLSMLIPKTTITLLLTHPLYITSHDNTYTNLYLNLINMHLVTQF
ncbi:hypothetical protein Hanom_Chr07g00612021 [Helianthus anomalus]